MSSSITLVRQAGPEALTIRGVARAAGVSSAAVYRHHANLGALKRAVGVQASRRLGATVEQHWNAVNPCQNPSLVAHLHFEAVGRGYLDFSNSERGLFKSLFAPVADGDGAPDALFDSHVHRWLTRAVDDLVLHGVLESTSRPGAELTALSAVHGLALILERDSVRATLRYEDATAAMLRTMATGLYDGPNRPF